MPLPSSLDSYIRDQLSLLVLLLVFAVVVLGILLVVTLRRLGKLNRLYTRLTHGASGGNLEEVILGYVDEVNTVSERALALEQKVDSHSRALQDCLHSVGIVRYDAFEDVGGEQSFSFVLLNKRRTGVAVSSVHSRNAVRVYAKAIREGKPSHPLTEEELLAMKQAEEN